MKLSTWLVPAAATEARLETLVGRFCAVFGSPRFPPHITLCGECLPELLGRGQLLETRALSLTLASLAFGDDYFHGCYLEVTENAQLQQLQKRCSAALGGKVPAGYPPHLSLAYGVLNPAQRQEAESLLGRLPIPVDFDRIEVWQTNGPVPAWRKRVPSP
jgi:hypothetical protein